MTPPPMTDYELPELLAPAGGREAFDAALAAGADAVYLGAGALNARRGADNFDPELLRQAVRDAHARVRGGEGGDCAKGGVRVHLALNIDLRQRDLGLAARWLAFARDIGVDALILRDPALFELAAAMRSDDAGFPVPEIHASTQAAPANAADVRAAGLFGARRAVLARELSLDEIAGVVREAGGDGVETEVFAQGSLCFSVSGRCLLSSWGGGRGGNRGACASPCRVPWRVMGAPAGTSGLSPTPMSLEDLAAIDRVGELARAGVRALKIEGRLKSAAWVAEAVGLYRRAMDRLPPASAASVASVADGADNVDDDEAVERQDLLRRAGRLGAYAGRRVGHGYLDGKRDGLVDEPRRPSADLPRISGPGPASALTSGPWPTSSCAPTPASASDSASGEGEAETEAETETEAGGAAERSFVLRAEAGGARFVLGLEGPAEVRERVFPKTVVRREKKAVRLADAIDAARAALYDTPAFAGDASLRVEIDDPDFLLPPRNANAIVDQCLAWAREADKSRVRNAARRGLSDAPLSGAAAERLAAVAAARTSAENRRRLGKRFDRVRFGWESRDSWDAPGAREGIASLVLENANDAPWEEVSAWLEGWEANKVTVVLAMPAVVFPPAWAGVEACARRAAQRGWTVEANSWGVAALCRSLSRTGRADWGWEAGPGLGALNSLAAAAWRDWGARAVVYSPEADRAALEDMSAVMDTPADLLVYGRPVLAVTRAELPEAALGGVWEDRRGIRLTARRGADGLTVFRPVEPFDWTDLGNPSIRARNLVAELGGVDDPAAEWRRLRTRFGARAKAPSNSATPTTRFRFNYERGLF